MADVITRQELEDAKLDAQTLEDFVNGPSEVLITRLGSERKSLALLEDLALGSPAALVARRYYATLAAAVADSGLTVGQVFTSDDEGTLSYYVKTSGSPFYQFVSTVVGSGLQTQGQLVVSGATAISRATHGGHNILVDASATLTFPAAGAGFATGESICVSNISATGTVTMTFTGGSDCPPVLWPGESVLLISDGGSYWRAFFFGGRQLRATSVAQMQAMQPAVGRQCLLDNGVSRGMFVCRAGSPPVADSLGGVYITIDTPTYYWERVWTGSTVNLAWFKPTGDGATDDRAKLVAADAFGHFRVPAGRYYVGSNLTLSSSVEFDPGAIIVVPDGVSVTFNGVVIAGVYQIFDWPAGSSKTGLVNLDRAKTFYGFAEWWGAQATLAVDSYAAISAAIKALLAVQLQAGDYLTSATILITNGHRSLIGAGSKYEDTTKEATRLLVSDGSSYVVRVGPSSMPGGGINAFQKDNLIKDIYLGRTVAPVISSACIGLRLQYVLSLRLENVKVSDSMVGFSFYGCVSSKARECESVRATAGTGGGTDYWRGFHMDGTAAIGAAGGNASLYLFDCAAGCNIGSLQTGDSYGFLLDGAFTDVFLDHPETVSCRIGIGVLGNDTAGNTFSNTDCRIEHPIMDQFRYCGIYITDVAEAGSIEVVDPYCGPHTAARASIWVNSSTGAHSIRGGQLVHGGASGVQPILVSDANNVYVDGTLILEPGNTYPAVGLGNANNCVIRPHIKSQSVAAGAAIQLSGTCSRNIVEPTVRGGTNKVQYGIQVVGTGDSYNEYRVSGIDTACLQGADANRKLDRNGTPVTAIGLTGTNYAVGVFA